MKLYGSEGTNWVQAFRTSLDGCAAARFRLGRMNYQRRGFKDQWLDWMAVPVRIVLGCYLLVDS